MVVRSLALLALCPLAAAAPPDAAYMFTLHAEVPSVSVSCTVAGDHDGHSRFGLVPDWGGLQGHGKEITDLAATGRDGRALVASRVSDSAWDVAHDPDEPLAISYTLREPPDRPPPSQFNDYRTQVKPGLFQMIGNIGLVFPDALDSDRPREFSIHWSGFDEAGWTVASSFGPGAAPRTVTMKPDEFRQSLFIAGNLRCPTRTIRGNTVGLAIYGDDWGFSDDRFADLAARVITAERDFFDDHSDPWFLITLIPTGKASPHGLSLGGTGLTHCLALYCNTGLDLSPGSDHERRILHLLAHEHFHNWNGSKIHTASHEGADYWFPEGFTDFFARRILLRSGLYTAAAFADEHNHALSRFDTSAVRSAPNDRIIKDFWTSREVNELPYLRGDLVAIAIDEQIRTVSGGRRSLDDLMRDLYAGANAGHPPVGTSDLFEAIERETSKPFTALIRAAILDGADIPLPDTMTEPPLALRAHEARAFDPGFDTAATVKAKVITGLREGSEAFKAGLRDGQKLLSMSVSSGDSTSPPAARVGVDDGSGKRDITFDPLGPPTPSRRYEPR